MSAYSTNKTLFKDKDLLCAALTDMGFKAEDIEYHAVATNLYGYHGDKRKDVANIIIRRGAVNRVLSGGASNDIGFKVNGDGTIGAIISAYDSNYASSTWLGKLTGNYAQRAIVQKAAKQGLRFVGKSSTNGKTKLNFVKA